MVLIYTPSPPADTNKVFGTEWFVLFGAALCGISAGIFWSVEGAIILGYPEASKRGMYLAVWLAFKSGGQVSAA